jgi:multisubunit Na+/H+ antiporter MnhE subunit
MEIMLWIFGYVLTVVLSWLMFRVAVTSYSEPQYHPLPLLAIVTFIPAINIVVSLSGMLICLLVGKNSKIDFVKFFRV